MDDERLDHPAVLRRRWRVALLDALVDRRDPETLEALRTQGDMDAAIDKILTMLDKDAANAVDYEAAAEDALNGDDLIEIVQLEQEEADLWPKVKKLASSS